MHYLIDGYNLMFRVFQDEENFEEQRQQIIFTLNQKIQATKLDVTLIFDAQYSEGEETRTHFHHLEILFSSHGETADDLILTMIQGTRDPRALTVVTSDRQLASTVRRFGGNCMTVEAFLAKLDKKMAKLKQSPVSKKSPNFDYYLHHFEENFRKLTKEDDS